MKCVNCSIEVSPNFVASIMDNKCPACGQQLMEGTEYKKLIALKKQLIPLGLDENMLTKVAAAVTSRFELIPRDANPPVEPLKTTDNQGEQKSVEENIKPAQMETAETSSQPPRQIKPIATKSNLKSKIEALMAIERESNFTDEPLNGEDADPQSISQIVKEWGLDKGSSSAVALVEDNVFDNDLNSMFSDFPLQGDDPMSSRMSRASALGETVNKFGIKPVKRV